MAEITRLSDRRTILRVTLNVPPYIANAIDDLAIAEQSERGKIISEVLQEYFAYRAIGDAYLQEYKHPWG